MTLQIGDAIGNVSKPAAAPRPAKSGLFAPPSLLSSINTAATNPALNTYTPDYSGILSHGATKVSNPTPIAQSAAPSANTSDYSKQLADDATLQQTLAGINATGTGEKASLGALQSRALATYGSIPDLPSGIAGDVNVDQVTRDLAAQNTQAGTSTVAQLQKAYQNQQQADNASLAARGMIHSGALGQHAQLDLTAYQQSQAQAQQQLLDTLSSYWQSWLGQQSQNQAAAASATNDALSRIIAQIQASTPDTSQASQPVVYDNGPVVSDTGTYVMPPTPPLGVPVAAPGAATGKKPGKTVGGYISGGAIRT